MTVFYCFFRPVVIEYCHTAEDSRPAAVKFTITEEPVKWSISND